MNSLNTNQENPLDIKSEILGAFQIVGNLLKKARLTEALSAFSSHFHTHLNQAFDRNYRNPEAAPAYFVDSIISEYFLFRPFPDQPDKEGFIKTPNSRALQVSVALILRELKSNPKIDLSSSQTLSNPQVLFELRETIEWFEE
jgi:hypothetical protein